MPANDRYGLERQRLIGKSKIRSIFTPSRPVNDKELFMGREDEVASILDYITTPGLHALLYGDRGVGKSSLSNITTTLLLKHFHDNVFQFRCDCSDTFYTILEGPLKKVGVKLFIKEKTCTIEQDGKAEAGVGFFRSGISSKRKTEEKESFSLDRISPSFVANRLSYLSALIVVDELDRLKKKEISKLAELMKLLSDSGSPCKLFLVGIAHSTEELTGSHPSVQRCLQETKLDPMSDLELRQIITSGEKKAGIKFSDLVKTLIVQMSAGYPHFTQLLSLKSAEQAIASKKKFVTNDHLLRAVELSVRDSELSLKAKYDEAIRSHSSDMAQKILVAISSLAGPEFYSSKIRSTVEKIFGITCSTGSFSHHMRKLASPGTATILRRLKPGVYTFNDPRMPCFIRIANYKHFEKYFKPN